MSDSNIKPATKKPRSIINVLALVNRARLAAGASKISAKPREPKAMKLNQSQKNDVGFEVLVELYPDYMKPDFKMTDQIVKAIKNETESRVKQIILGKRNLAVTTLPESNTDKK